ncbi:hypothetical protein CABS01_00273 [Colletotrichum abscissum]|uniref:Uncharacterized protein n=1 Tax=Colletotrichum abscissum TaxID=1671311 RepID=A0A9P9XB27_9PEZI|nr:uncharacterized protein CABS01_00273 [Colletotrichum abscissum]KAI3544154.1 hypothetical protein CABS02_09828 [Colletotrichum abscissum]KAK1525184.1 hypothetical protein CABS01_00273 [Colletotrichum abscissum]
MRRDGVAAARRRRSVQQPFPSPKLRRPVDLLPQPFFPQTLMLSDMNPATGKMPGWPALSYPTPVAPAEKKADTGSLWGAVLDDQDNPRTENIAKIAQA